jgi:hypothetical protein
VVPVHKPDKLDHEPETSLRESNIEKHNRRTKQRVDKTAVIEGAALAANLPEREISEISAWDYLIKLVPGTI